LFFRADHLEQFGTEGRGQNRAADARVDRPELLVQQAVFEETVAGPAVFLVNKDADETQVTGP
jgi:hypothetical protein